MPNIDMNSIISKAKKVMQSPKYQKLIEQKTDALVLSGDISSGTLTSSGRMAKNKGACLAAAKFIEVLCNEIESLGVGRGSGGFSNGKLGATAVSTLINLEHGSPYKIGKNKYQIAIYFRDDLSRDSLAIDEYPDGIDNIAALLNNGYNAGNIIYGVWLNHSGSFNIPSLAVRDGAHFIESAVRNYMGNYADEYGVVDIEVNDVYK